MRALVVYESMYGNTHVIADHIAAGLSGGADVQVAAVHQVTSEQAAQTDLLVVGGPTHVHGMTSARSRASAQQAAAKPGSDLTLEPDVDGPGLRDWLADLTDLHGTQAAAFDTRLDGSPALTGRAAKKISSRLARHGCTLVAPPQSFLVDKHNHLLPGEADRAQQWAANLLVHTPA